MAWIVAKQSYNFQLSGKINDSSSMRGRSRGRGRRAVAAAERRVIVAAIKGRWADRRRGGSGGGAAAVADI